MEDFVAKIVDYVLVIVMFVVVALIGYFRGKFYSNKPPVKLPDNSKELNAAKDHAEKAKESEQKAKDAAKAGDAEAQAAKDLQNAADKKHNEAEQARKEAEALVAEAERKKQELAELEKQNNVKTPKTIEELDRELK